MRQIYRMESKQEKAWAAFRAELNRRVEEGPRGTVTALGKLLGVGRGTISKYKDGDLRGERVPYDKVAGIAATIRKNFWEKIQRAFAGASDVKLIHSALMGDFRTKTKQKERGLGLPAIFRYYRNGHLQNFHLISTSAALHAGDNGQLIQQPLPVAFKGTLFAWRTGEVIDEKGN